MKDVDLNIKFSHLVEQLGLKDVNFHIYYNGHIEKDYGVIANTLGEKTIPFLLNVSSLTRGIVCPLVEVRLATNGCYKLFIYNNEDCLIWESKLNV